MNLYNQLRRPPLKQLTGNPSERDRFSPDFALGSLTSITLVVDTLCPWCWVGWVQAQKLQQEFGVTFDWRHAELIPPEMEFNPSPPKPRDPNSPPDPPRPPSRFDLFLETEGIPLASPRPPFVRTHSALLGAEFAWAAGRDAFDVYNEAQYRGYWENHDDLADLDVLTGYANRAGLDTAAFRQSVESEQYARNIIPFDDDAYAIGVRHVPTFIFNAEEVLAEAPYSDLARATERFLIRSERFRER